MNVQRLVSKTADEANEPVGTVAKITRRLFIKLACYPIAEVEETLKGYAGLDESDDGAAGDLAGKEKPKKKARKKSPSKVTEIRPKKD